MMNSKVAELENRPIATNVTQVDLKQYSGGAGADKKSEKSSTP